MSNAERGTENGRSDPVSGVSLPENPDRAEMRAVVRRFKREGICGRRVGEQHVGPYLLASPAHGQREFDLLEAVLDEEYGDTDFCIRERSSDCRRLRGGCKGDR